MCVCQRCAAMMALCLLCACANIAACVPCCCAALSLRVPTNSMYFHSMPSLSYSACAHE